jgi:lipoprotein-anchoring transpeptidase ErfK/SrfK
MSAHRTSTTRALAGLAASLLLCVGLSACNGSDSSNEQAQGDSAAPGGAETTPAAETEVELTSNVKNPRAVPIDKDVRFEAVGGTLEKVVVRSGKGAELPGGITADDTAWEAKGRLEPGTTYTARAVTKTPGGTTKRATTTFRTVDLSLDQQTYASVAPLSGETVGVGMPVIVTFDVPVTDKKSIEKHMTVTSTPRQAGSWHWLSDNEVHWRPKSYWQAGTDVTVDVDVNSVPAGNGVYGQESRTVKFHVGDAVISKVNAQTHQMKTFINGKLVKTTPITTGKPGHTTRSGVKVIIEKFRQKRMNSETVGIDPNSADGYDIDDVEYAMRVTFSGEFLHAAPWSVADQGHANVSHGCTGMSTADAKWIYDRSKRGDVVEYTGTDRQMTLTNGYGDWNASFASWKAGSAL